MDLPQQYRSLEKPIQSAINHVLKKGVFIGGEEISCFEKEFADALNVPHCIGVGNGTDALFLALKVLGVGPGDHVIVPANTFIASAEAVTMTGATPLFVDCDPSTFLLNLEEVELILLGGRKGVKSVKAIMPVHLYGRAVDMSRLMRMAAQHKVFVVEDCAQAHFAKHNNRFVGTWGDIGCFSFYPGKNLGAYGDAGALVTQRHDLAEALRKLHDHGRSLKYEHDMPGINSRLDAMQAAVLRVKLPYVSKWNEQRRHHALRYNKICGAIPDITLPRQSTGEDHVYHLYVIRTKMRDALRQALQDKGISTGIHYPTALPNTRAYRSLGYRAEDFPVATSFQNTILSLPMFPELTPEQIQYVGEAITDFFKGRKR